MAEGVEVDPIKIFVGTDESQFLAVKVLEYSIKKHCKNPVEVIPMINLKVPKPKDPQNQARTGFSFFRFCIPELCHYKGRAIYMDADMLVFRNIQELWNLPFNGKKLLAQSELTDEQKSNVNINSPKRRWKQCSVMLLDCSALQWEVKAIVQDLDAGKYNYDQLFRELCILEESDVGYTIPYEWNSLEHWDQKTGNIHYTDMGTQPWVSPFNKWGLKWYETVKEMMDQGILSRNQIISEIAKGHFRPSLLTEIDNFNAGTKYNRLKASYYFVCDKLAGYKKHKIVYQQTKDLKLND
jgi:lipopolysaccharide biosynthesis glycosyltransferase